MLISGGCKMGIPLQCWPVMASGTLCLTRRLSTLYRSTPMTCTPQCHDHVLWQQHLVSVCMLVLCTDLLTHFQHYIHFSAFQMNVPHDTNDGG